MFVRLSRRLATYVFRVSILRAGDGDRFVGNTAIDEPEIADGPAFHSRRKARLAFAGKRAEIVYALCGRLIALARSAFVYIYG